MLALIQHNVVHCKQNLTQQHLTKPNARKRLSITASRITHGVSSCMNDMLTIAGDDGFSGIEVGVVSGFIFERIRENLD